MVLGKFKMKKKIICVVGLGYVGLPLAVKFGQTSIKTYGLDLKKEKIEELNKNYDSMNEVDSEELKNTNVEYTCNSEIISKANFIIVAVPTPIDEAKKPDITLLKKASEMIGKYIQKGSTVVYESTVYPGCTEEDCMPIIEKVSNMKCGESWFIGYSPERVNPGDKEHTIDKIVKVSSGMNAEVAEDIALTYETIITAVVHRASSIKVAEAAKVIENTQRDINIALMNELAVIFEKMNINTNEVLEAAGTKWNFLPFKPGLVGGHCIGVDPYYLVHKAQLLGHHAQIIGAGRRLNDNMPRFIARQVVKILISQGKVVKNSKVLILGLTFKENVNDMRNSKVKELIRELKEFNIICVAHDPYLYKEDTNKYFGIENKNLENTKEEYDGIILAVSHKEFKEYNLEFLKQLCKKEPIFYDIKNMFKAEELKKHGFLNKTL
jgi:UDP-N-acetyl-D-galactosamine dehydrogenase